MRSGYDHIAFVLGLVLLGGGWLATAGAISGFTLGHALALAAFASGLARAEPRGVEVLVALSVVFVGLERFARRVRRGQLLALNACAHAFVAIVAAHGGTIPQATLLGSAVLTSSTLWLRASGAEPRYAGGCPALLGIARPRVRRDAAQRVSGRPNAWSLLGFNVGVEAAQLAAAALAIVAVAALGRIRVDHEQIAELGAAMICAAGVYWGITRDRSWIRIPAPNSMIGV